MPKRESERESLKEVLIRRDNLSSQEADNWISDAQNELMELMEEGNMIDAENICMDFFGLEEDYLMDLL